MLLQSKKKLNNEVAQQKKQQIDEGIKIATKVDAVRQTLATEEANLNTFREQTLKIIQGEIDVKVREKDSLGREVEFLTEQRIKLQAPIDLTQEWDKVKKDKAEVEAKKDKLFVKEVDITSREVEIEVRSKELTQWDTKLNRKEAEVDRNLTLALENFGQSEKDIKSASDIKRQALKDKAETEEYLSNKEDVLLIKERNLEAEKEKILSDQEAIRSEKIRLADMRGTLERALARLK